VFCGLVLGGQVIEIELCLVEGGLADVLRFKQVFLAIEVALGLF